jgi:DNA modification methylase
VKPYYQDEAVTIYHGDSRAILPTIAMVCSVVVTDPPYGCSATTSHGGKFDGFEIAGDRDTTARDWLITATSMMPMVMLGSPRIERPKCRQVLIWSKGEHTGMGDLDFPWKPDFEEIYIFGDGFSGPRTSSVLQFNADTSSRRSHPTEKPEGLMRALIAKCPSGIVLDPFMGSGTTLEAAKRIGRASIGIELEERYCEIAAKRCAQGVLSF